MGESLWAGKRSWYVTSHLGQLSLPSLWGTIIEYHLATTHRHYDNNSQSYCMQYARLKTKKMTKLQGISKIFSHNKHPHINRQ